MPDRSGPSEGAKGVVEDIKGRFKEAAGAITGDDSKVREGQAQQDKAGAQREVADKEAAAERARAEADVHEVRERSNQDK
ncbi:CsbD family protein [Actinophytocola glycyrrhizae]|uniref:CsbD family protein n=1 Tax=Actinophytocola glycyrrhizae TaxID=2044873 RepID=A0ABV9S8G7_9PSEU